MKKRLCIFLGLFESLRKATISFDMSVRLYEPKNAASTARIFTKSDKDYYSKIVEKIQVS
jgi:hypothetical protein